MRFFENLTIARVVLALAIVLSLVLSGGNALLGRRGELEASFSAPAESISAEVREMRSNAASLLGIAQAYEAANAEYTAALNDAIAALDAAQDASQMYDASLLLDSAVESCYSDLSRIELSEVDVEDVRYVYKNFTSAQLRISHDEYNLKAAEFNAELSAFPASLLAMVRGIRPLSLFQ